MNNKKVLILTVTCGEGHNSIAKSIFEQVNNLGATAKIVDLFESDPKKQKNYNKAYLWSMKHIPHIYEIGWNFLRNRISKNLEKSIPVKNTKKFANHILEIINEYKPDVIFCSHNEAGALLSYLKQKNLLSQNIKTSTFVFDYVLCPFWETNKYLDYCFTPAEFLHNDLIKKGFKEEQFKCFGFPVASSFYNTYDKAELRKKYDLKDRFTFFSIAGGNNLGNPIKLLKSILKVKTDKDKYQVIMACSKNKKNKQKLDKYIAKHKIDNVKTFGFVDNIVELFAVGDVAFSRGGSGAINECFVRNIPIIFRTGLVINERINKNIFTAMGCAFSPKNGREITEICNKILQNPSILETCKANIKNFNKPNPALNIAKFLVKKA